MSMATAIQTDLNNGRGKKQCIVGEGAKAMYCKVLDYSVIGKGATTAGLRAINLVTGETEVIAFDTVEDMRAWMLAHNFGLKVFKSKREWREERECLIRLYEAYTEDAREDLIDEHTCIATFDHEGMPYFAMDCVFECGTENVKITRCMVYQNADHDLRSAQFLTHNTLNAYPRKCFRSVLKKCVRFLEFIHSHTMFYGDWKCRNVFAHWATTISDDVEDTFKRHKQSNLIAMVGDIGSLRYVRNEDIDGGVDISKYTYTFKAPYSGDEEDGNAFVEFWTKGKGSKFTFIRNIPQPCKYIFEDKFLRKTVKNWKKKFDTTDTHGYTFDESDTDEETDSDNESAKKRRRSNKPSVHNSVEMACAVDWFALGIMLIELICYIHNQSQTAMSIQTSSVERTITHIYNTFCHVPCTTESAPVLAFVNTCL